MLIRGRVRVAGGAILVLAGLLAGCQEDQALPPVSAPPALRPAVVPQVTAEEAQRRELARQMAELEELGRRYESGSRPLATTPAPRLAPQAPPRSAALPPTWSVGVSQGYHPAPAPAFQPSPSFSTPPSYSEPLPQLSPQTEPDPELESAFDSGLPTYPEPAPPPSPTPQRQPGVYRDRRGFTYSYPGRQRRPVAEERHVWVTDHRSVYHGLGCNYLARSAHRIPLRQAQQEGLGPCERCGGG